MLTPPPFQITFSQLPNSDVRCGRREGGESETERQREKRESKRKRKRESARASATARLQPAQLSCVSIICSAGPGSTSGLLLSGCQRGQEGHILHLHRPPQAGQQRIKKRTAALAGANGQERRKKMFKGSILRQF